jgi:hypothetical protein
MASIAAGIVALTGQVALVVAALIGADCVGVAIFLAVGMGSSHRGDAPSIVRVRRASSRSTRCAGPPLRSFLAPFRPSG